MNIAIIIVAVYIIAMFIINAYFVKKNNDTKEYFVAGSRLGVAAVMSQAFCALIGGSTTVGTVTNGFKFGVSGMFPTWSQALGCVCFLMFGYKISRVLHEKRGFMSPCEVSNFRFNSATRLLDTIDMIIGFGLIYAITPKAMGAVLQPLFGGTVETWAYISAIVVVGITLLGGLKGLAKMNVVNLVLMYVIMIVACVVGVKYAGGMDAIKASENVPETHFSLFGQGVEYFFASLLAGYLCSATSPVFSSGAFAAASYKKGWKGLWIAVPVVMVFAVFPMIFGIAARSIMPDAAPTTVFYTLAAEISPVLHGLTAMCVLAACLSSGTSFLLYISTLFTRDIYLRFKPNAEEKAQLTFGKVSTVVIGLLFTWIGLKGGALLSILTDAFVILSATCWPLILGQLWPKYTRQAGFWTVLAGLIASVYWYIAGHPFGISGVWATAAACILAGVIATLITSKGPQDEGYTTYKALEAEYLASPDYDM